jgi:hypothetical protein
MFLQLHEFTFCYNNSLSRYGYHGHFCEMLHWKLLQFLLLTVSFHLQPHIITFSTLKKCLWKKCVGNKMYISFLSTAIVQSISCCYRYLVNYAWCMHIETCRCSCKVSWWMQKIKTKNELNENTPEQTFDQVKKWWTKICGHRLWV